MREGYGTCSVDRSIVRSFINPRRMREGYGTCSVINPRPEGYGSRFVILSIYLSVNSATENSAHFFVPVKVRTG